MTYYLSFRIDGMYIGKEMYFLSIVLCCLFLRAFAKPSHVREDYDRETNEDSYRDTDGAPDDDYLQNEKKRSSLKQFSGNEPDTKVEQMDEKAINQKDDIGRSRSDQDYLNENQADGDHLLDTEVKRTAGYSNGYMLFPDRERPQNIHRHGYNSDDRTGSNAQGIRDNSIHNTDSDEVNRERRQIDSNEEKELAIRRHIKKLTKEELDELLQSLSVDKRSILKNLIDNTPQDSENINKREITKKAGANEEPSLVGNDQSDTSKVQGSSLNFEGESMDANSLKLSSTKKENSDSVCSSVSPHVASSSEKSSDKIFILNNMEDTKLEKSDNLSEADVKIIANINSDNGSNKENKREINSKSYIQSETVIQDSENLSPTNNNDFCSESKNKREILPKSFVNSLIDSNIQESEDLSSPNSEDYCSENEDLSKLWNGEYTSYNNNNQYKREIHSDKLNSVKSLQESFPNVDKANNLISGLDMAPLVRVKRTNPNKKVEKRDSIELSNLKVPFFSSAVESNEEDNDEGSEFQEKGLYGKIANLAKTGEINRQQTDSYTNNGNNNEQYYVSNSQTSRLNAKNTASLGSDTDAVLSGIEGVDDNIMYNSIVRSKRTASKLNKVDNASDNNELNESDTAQRGSQNEDSEISDSFNNALPYQENDAFGSLPQNYEKDLSRFKRIRRLKPLLCSENNVSNAKH